MTTFRILFVALFIWVSGATAFTQDVSATFTGEITQTAIDRAGDFYAVTPAGIHKFDSMGRVLSAVNVYTPVTLFDPGNGVRLLAYFRDTQEYAIYSPELRERQRVKIDPSFAISPWLACASGDYDLLILDAADWSVKKVDTRGSVVSFEFNLDPALAEHADFVFMREYLGFLFLHDRNTGITVYNRLGMKLRSLPASGAGSFNFRGEELYYYLDDRIYFTNLYTLETRVMPFTCSCSGVLLGAGRAMTVKDESLEFLPFAKTPSER